MSKISYNSEKVEKLSSGSLTAALDNIQKIISQQSPEILSSVSPLHARKIESRWHTYKDEYENLIQSVPFGIVKLDKNGKIISANKYFCKLLGYDKWELDDIQFATLKKDHDNFLINNKIFEDLSLGQILPIPFDDILLTRDNNSVYVQINWDYLKDESKNITGYKLIVSDITDRVKYEEKLRKSEHSLRLLFDSLQQKVFLKDRNLVYRSCNKSFALSLGLERANVKNKTDYDLFEKNIAKNYRKDDQLVLNSGESLIKTDKYIENGIPKHIKIVRTPTKDETGRIDGVLGIFWDISEQVKAENEIKKLNQELEKRVIMRTAKLVAARNHLLNEIEERKKLQQEVMEVSEREKRLIGQELHDSIGQQFVAVSFMLKNLEKKVSEKQPELIGEIKKIADYNTMIMNQTRAIARGLNPVNVSEHGLFEALQGLNQSIQELFGIQCSFDCSHPLNIKNDQAVHVYRIVQEAITNALKHSCSTCIEIKVTEQKEQITLKIIADGNDFPEEKKISKGIGLKIMEKRAEMIGGKFTIQKNPSGGVMVTLKFPFIS